MNLLQKLTSFSDKERFISPVIDPFKKDGVKDISFRMYRSIFYPHDWNKPYAVIQFEVGNTKGEQRFEADDFGTLVKQVEEFIKNLS